MSRPSIVWFRRDLRIADHPALAEAAGRGPVIGLFVVDPRFDGAGLARRSILGAALDGLDAAIGRRLVIRHGRPVDVVPVVAAECSATEVFVTGDAAPYGRQRDAEVSARLRTDGRHLRSVGWNTVVAPGSVVTRSGSPFRVFTPFARAWREHLPRAPLDAAVTADWRALPSDDARLPRGFAEWLGGQQRWAEFVGEGGLDAYAERRNLPAIDGTSRLSAALRWGAVHPRQLLADIGPEHGVFLNELAWREFHADVLYGAPHSTDQPLDERFAAMPVDTDASAVRRFERWCSGTTGYPIVDAGMRQLLGTGWMHNRVRMIVGSFLVKDLHLPWQWGARHFMRHLIDGDRASNTHNWQWVAGCGTDAAPYFRIFNPTLQSERFDPDGEYLRTWVPELAAVPTRQIHAPGSARPADYPPPIVDHAEARAESLARYRATVGRTRPAQSTATSTR